MTMAPLDLVGEKLTQIVPHPVIVSSAIRSAIVRRAGYWKMRAAERAERQADLAARLPPDRPERDPQARVWPADNVKQDAA